MSEDKTKIEYIKDYERAKDAGLDGVTDVNFNSLNECQKRGYRAGKMIRSKIINEVIQGTKKTNDLQERSIDKREKIINKQEEIIKDYKGIIYCLWLLVMALAGGVCYFSEVF